MNGTQFYIANTWSTWTKANVRNLNTFPEAERSREYEYLSLSAAWSVFDDALRQQAPAGLLVQCRYPSRSTRTETLPTELVFPARIVPEPVWRTSVVRWQPDPEV
jgi:hypothetical protein